MFAFGDKELPGLAKLVEETGEAGEEVALLLLARHLSRVEQVAGKLMMTHGEADHWDGDIRHRLIFELGDLSGIMIFLRQHVITPEECAIWDERSVAKALKFEGWHRDPEADPPPRSTQGE